MWTSGRISMPTMFSQEAPPCTLVLATGCRRKSLPLLHPPSRSRSLLHLRGSTLYGLVDPSLLHSPPFSLCGSLSRNMTNLAQESFTANASKNLMEFFKQATSSTRFSIYLLIHILGCIRKSIQVTLRKVTFLALYIFQNTHFGKKAKMICQFQN